MERHREHETLKINHVIGAFCILAIGSILAACTLYIEIINNNWRLITTRKWNLRFLPAHK